MEYMKASSRIRKTAWDDVPMVPRPKLANDMKVEVAVVGGGLAGILIAYELARAGKQAAVFDANRLGEGVTRYTTAFLTQDIDTDLSDLVSMFGSPTARQIWQSHARAIDCLEEISKREKISCDFKRCPLFVYANDEDELSMLEDEQAAARKLGFDTSLVRRASAFTDFGYWHLRQQAKFHPLRFMAGVAEKAEAAGAKIFERSKVSKISGTNRLKLEVNNRIVIADNVVIATYQPFNNPRPTVLKKGMYVSYVLEVEVPKSLFKEGLYLDESNPYHYFRIDRVGSRFDRMIIGGEDHRQEIKMSAAKNYRVLESYLKKLMDGKAYRVIRRWKGPILEPASGLAMIGRTKKENQYVATAFSGNGMTYSMTAAGVMRDLILGKKNPDIKLYDPARHITLKQLYHKGKDYAEELIGGAVKNSLR